MNTTSIVAYLTLFASVGFLFLFASLLLGRFLRPNKPNDEKLAVYECGEKFEGTSRVRYDLRFYVVALVFLILDVEVAFFFPWATVFGKSVQLMSPEHPKAVAVADDSPISGLRTVVSLAPAAGRIYAAERIYRELGVAIPTLPKPAETVEINNELICAEGRSLSLAAMADMLVFFGVLLVGFAYVWWRGDLDWIRTF